MASTIMMSQTLNNVSSIWGLTHPSGYGTFMQLQVIGHDSCRLQAEILHDNISWCSNSNSDQSCNPLGVWVMQEG